METEKVITTCSACPFWGNTMDGMECRHPHWETQDAWANMIVNQDNYRDGNAPDECPLRREDLTVTYHLNLKK